ncbi:MAG: hypothetical protein ACOYMW_16525 [Candidatus Competibacteraceae bacterium]|jgi:hypothetical protein
MTESVKPNEEIKISAAILALSEPYLKKYSKPHQVQGVITLTIAAWNLSLVTGKEQAHLERLLRDGPLAGWCGEDVASVLNVVDTLVEHKRRDYPEVHEFILKHDLSYVDGTITLTVGTAPMLPERLASSA